MQSALMCVSDIFILLIATFDMAIYLISEIAGDGILVCLSLLLLGLLSHSISLAGIHLGNINPKGVPQGSILGPLMLIIMFFHLV